MTMTERNSQAWAHLQPKWREKRMRDWAEMLEFRVKQLDPDYEAFPWGRKMTANVIDSTCEAVVLNKCAPHSDA